MGVCVAAVSGMTAAVASVARSAAVAAMLHVLCFSAVKVGVGTALAGLLACVASADGPGRRVFSGCKGSGVGARQEEQGPLGRPRGGRRHS